MTDPRAVAGTAPGRSPQPWLPAVAVVDHALVAGRRGSRLLARRAGVVLMGVGISLVLGARGVLPPAARLVGLTLVVAGALLAVWAAPWTGPRHGADWYLGIERDGLRVTHGLAVGGQVFLPWAAVTSVRRRRYLGVTAYLHVRLHDAGGPWLQVFDPAVADTVRRRGLRIGLQGTSMSAAEAAAVIAQVRP